MQKEISLAMWEKRFIESAIKAYQFGFPVFTPFLTPPEYELAKIQAKKNGTSIFLFGGYEDSERKIACFSNNEILQNQFKVSALQLRWKGFLLTHRDVLGSLMALGIERNTIGDILVNKDNAVIFCLHKILPFLYDNLSIIGKNKVSCSICETLPTIAKAEGKEVKSTVSSPRLDAIVATAFRLSRTKASQLITGGFVKLQYQPCIKPDVNVNSGDRITLRGMGKAHLLFLGEPTKKGRIPVSLVVYGK